MSVINCRKKNLQENGYDDFEDWNSNKDNVYIGRNMNYYVKGAIKSKWCNPYPVKKYGLDKCLEMYKKYLYDSGLIDDIEELRDKNLGCWCAPSSCHGDILLDILEKK